MKKRWKGLLCLIGLCTALCMPMTAMADGHKVVALGADLSPEQVNTVLRYFGVQNKSIETIYVTNTDERNHLGSYIPIEQIGSRTISCAFVNPTTSGGIQVKTANMNYVTSRMIASTLSTAGVVNCEVLAAAPFEVSGTGALTGVMMAYENAVGNTLDPVKKDVATQELITTEAIAQQVGQETATQIVNDIKIQIVANEVKEPQEVNNIVNQTVNRISNVTINEEDYSRLEELAQRIAEQEYEFEDMKETLERIDAGVTKATDEGSDLADLISGEIEENESVNEEEDEEDLEELADSIFNATDDQAFGEETIIDATSDEAMDGYTEVLEDAGFELPEPEPVEEPEPAPSDEEEVQEQSIFGQEDDFDWNAGEDDDEDAPEDVSIFDEAGAFGEENDVAEDDAFGQDEISAEESFENDDPFGLNEEAEEGEDDVFAEGGEEAGEDAGEEAAALEVTESILCALGSDETSDAAGENVLKYSIDVAGASILSGSLDVNAENGENVAHVDLSESSKVYTKAMSGEDLLNSMWAAGDGTTFYVLLGKQLDNNAVYNVTLNAVITNESGQTGEVSKEEQIRTGQFGVSVDLNDIHDLHTGASLSGSLAVDPETVVYAEITSSESSSVAFDKTTFDIASGETDFTMTLNSPGTSHVEFDYYGADGYIGSFTYYANVLE